jgi:DNA polymerase III epsilon subunit-like protein
MLDIETMGTRPGAMIAAIGACTFGEARCIEQHRLDLTVSLAGQEARGLHADADTVLWWMAQSEEARAALTRQASALPLPEALAVLQHFLGMVAADRQLCLWCNGANFDAPLLEAAYRACGRPVPWRYSAVRDLRTLLELAGVDPKAYRPAVAHRALDDALAQAAAAEEALRILAARRPA